MRFLCACLIVLAIFYEMGKAFFCVNVTDQLELWQLPFTAIDFNVTLKAPNSTIILLNCHKQRLITVEFGLKESSKDCQLKLACCFFLRHKSEWESLFPRLLEYYHHFQKCLFPKVIFKIQKMKMYCHNKSCLLK